MTWELGENGDGYWAGPPSLPVLLRENRLDASVFLLADVGVVTLGWTRWEALPTSAGVTLGIISGAVVWLGHMFACSRGWIRDGE